MKMSKTSKIIVKALVTGGRENLCFITFPLMLQEGRLYHKANRFMYVKGLLLDPRV